MATPQEVYDTYKTAFAKLPIPIKWPALNLSTPDGYAAAKALLGDKLPPYDGAPANMFAAPGAPPAPAAVSKPVIATRLGRRPIGAPAVEKDICTRYQEALARGSVAAPRLKIMCEEARRNAGTERVSMTDGEPDNTKTYLLIGGGVVLALGAWMLLKR